MISSGRLWSFSTEPQLPSASMTRKGGREAKTMQGMEQTGGAGKGERRAPFLPPSFSLLLSAFPFRALSPFPTLVCLSPGTKTERFSLCRKPGARREASFFLVCFGTKKKDFPVPASFLTSLFASRAGRLPKKEIAVHGALREAPPPPLLETKEALAAHVCLPRGRKNSRLTRPGLLRVPWRRKHFCTSCRRAFFPWKIAPT